MALTQFLRAVLKARWRERIRSRQAIERYAQNRLDQLLEHAVHNVPLQAERMQGMRSFTDISPIQKGEMMRRLSETLARNTVTAEEIQTMSDDGTQAPKWIRNQYLVSKTSGTTGERAVFVTNQAAWEEQRAAVFARICRGFSPAKRLFARLRGEKFRMAKLVADCPFCVSRQSALDAQINSKFMSEVLLLSIMDSEDDVISALNKFRPHFLYLYTSAIAAIARKRLRGAKVSFNPAAIITSCEAMTSEDQALIHAAFPDSRIVNQYGATECPALGVACQAGQLHLNIDYVKLEPVDANNQPVPVGEFSQKTLITNLSNTVQPIIRYELTDSVRILDEPCRCGSSLPVIEIRGRSDDTLFLLDSNQQYREVLPLAVYTGMFECKEIDFCQVVHVGQNVLELRVKPTEGVDRNHANNSARHCLQSILASRNVDKTTQIEVVILDSLPRSANAGKFKSTHSLVPRPNN